MDYIKLIGVLIATFFVVSLIFIILGLEKVRDFIFSRSAFLLDYKYKTIRFFGDGEHETIYELTILQKGLFGSKEVKTDYSISMFGSISDHLVNWDRLIKSKVKLEK